MNASYYIFLAGNFISQIGDKIYEIALAWYILEKTGSAISMGGMLVFASLPILLIGPFAGSYIDKVNKKWVMAATDFLRGFLIFYLTWRVYLKNLEVFEVYIAGFILSSLSCFFNPAATASIPFLVEERYIVKATAFNQMARDFSTIAGAATGGAIVGFFGVYMAFLLNASSFMVSGVCILIIKLSTPVVAETVSIIANLKDGFKYVYSQKTIFHILTLFSGLNFFGIPTFLFLPLFVTRILKMDSVVFGFAEAAVACGSFAGGFLISKYQKHNEKVNKKIFMSILLSGIFISMVSVVKSKELLYVLMFWNGFALAICNINMIAFFQKMVPDEYKGRFFSILETIAFATFPLAFAVFGYAAERYSVANLYTFCGTMIFFIALLFKRIKGVNEI